MTDKRTIPEQRESDIAVVSGKADPRDPEQKDKAKAKDAPRDEENLEEGLEDTMDGSDPVSATQP